MWVGIARSGRHDGAAISTFWRTQCSTKRAARWRRRGSPNASACLRRSTLALPEIEMQSDTTPRQAARPHRGASARGARPPSTRWLASPDSSGARPRGGHRPQCHLREPPYNPQRAAPGSHGAGSQGERDADRGVEHRRVIAELKNQLRQLATQNAALLKRALDAEAKATRLSSSCTADPRD